MVFDDNINALMRVNPALAARLMMVETNERYEVFVDEKDPANINIYDKSNNHYWSTSPNNKSGSRKQSGKKPF